MRQECVNSEDRTTIFGSVYKRLREKAGNGFLLGKIVGRSRQGARKWQWTGVPAEHIFMLEDELGIPAYDIHPFFYPKERILKWAEQIRSDDHDTHAHS